MKKLKLGDEVTLVGTVDEFKSHASGLCFVKVTDPKSGQAWWIVVPTRCLKKVLATDVMLKVTE